jgi:hypothetical protein
VNVDVYSNNKNSMFSFKQKRFYSLLGNDIRNRQIRDIDNRTNSTLTESRHVSMQVNAPNTHSLRIVANGSSERSSELGTTTVLSELASEHKN